MNDTNHLLESSWEDDPETFFFQFPSLKKVVSLSVFFFQKKGRNIDNQLAIFISLNLPVGLWQNSSHHIPRHHSNVSVETITMMEWRQKYWSSLHHPLLPSRPAFFKILFWFVPAVTQLVRHELLSANERGKSRPKSHKQSRVERMLLPRSYEEEDGRTGFHPVFLYRLVCPSMTIRSGSFLFFYQNVFIFFSHLFFCFVLWQRNNYSHTMEEECFVLKFKWGDWLRLSFMRSADHLFVFFSYS